MCSPFAVIIPFYICDSCVWTSLGLGKRGRGSLPGTGRAMCSVCLCHPRWAEGPGSREVFGRPSTPGVRARTGTPELSSSPLGSPAGRPLHCCSHPPGNQTSEGLLLAISEHEQQMSDVLVMLFQSLGVQSDPDHLGACYDPQSPSPVPAVLAGPSGTPVPAGKSLTSRLSEGTEGRVSGAGAQDPSSLSWDGREV